MAVGNYPLSYWHLVLDSHLPSEVAQSVQGHHPDILGHKMMGRHIQMMRAGYDRHVCVHQGASSMNRDISWALSNYGP